MTDEQVAELLCEAYDRAKPVWWIVGTDDKPETRSAARVAERWLSVVQLTREQLEANKREQTAAAMLASMINAYCVGQQDRPSDAALEAVIRLSVKMTDALRAELAKVKS